MEQRINSELLKLRLATEGKGAHESKAKSRAYPGFLSMKHT